MTLREIALKYIWSWLGRPYIWAGDDPSGVDCSGLIVETLQGVGLLPHNSDFSAEGLYEHFRDKSVQSPRAGVLVFWINASGKPIHVGMCVDLGIVLQAAGGGRMTKSIDKAWEHNAFVKLRPVDYRRERRVYVDPFKGTD